MNAPDKAFDSNPTPPYAPVHWHANATSRVPYRTYTDEALYQEELKRLFYSGHWCYVALAAEIPQPGDFKRTFVGERQVIVVRDSEGAINVVENHCAHRGVGPSWVKILME